MDAATIMLLPDKTYREANPKSKDAHLTVAFYGPASQLRSETRSRLQSVVQVVADQFDPITAQANGIGIFGAGADGVAVVDLIDGIGTHRVRALVDTFDGLDGAKIDKRHGFNPHVTREYLAKEDRDYGGLDWEDISNLEFTFDTIALWVEYPNGGRFRFEVSL